MISVIVPVYNAEKFIKRCIDSILCQTYKDFELILINDGSKDNSYGILQDYEKTDVRIKLYNQDNQGVSSARNKGLEIAKGDYVLFIDSDDWIESNMFEILINNIKKSNSEISCCQYDKNISDEISEFEIWSRDAILSSFIEHKKINGSLVNKLIKREVISDIKFDITVHYGEDALFLWKILLNVNFLCITNKVLYHVVLHNDSASGGGSYKPIRKDCIKVWQIIVQDTEQISLLLNNLAKAQLANMAFYSIYEMFYYKYKNSNDIKLFLKVLKSNLQEFKDAKFISKSQILFSEIMIKNLFLAKFLIIFKKMLKYYTLKT